jgi:hypothetical protein
VAKLIMRLNELVLLGAFVLLWCSKWSTVCVLSGARISQLRAVVSLSGDVLRWDELWLGWGCSES